ncbi:hypothetical protein N658DRAFT_500100 [Parathielavia hyrcaniae]|uniref:Uncharacterized protein n=1 Tax=Parathielavia hyrcaniae TaxID=113614 RepID=A0AAN6PW79_9PEZI|nr:hypothetical protein N658DRAFT_500100 [Parathielavia hyrcaniae]
MRGDQTGSTKRGVGSASRACRPRRIRQTGSSHLVQANDQPRSSKTSLNVSVVRLLPVARSQTVVLWVPGAPLPAQPVREAEHEVECELLPHTIQRSRDNLCCSWCLRMSRRLNVILVYPTTYLEALRCRLTSARRNAAALIGIARRVLRDTAQARRFCIFQTGVSSSIVLQFLRLDQSRPNLVSSFASAACAS